MNQTLKLTEVTRKLLEDRPRSLTYAMLAKELGVSVEWMKSFASGRTESSASKVQALYERLTGRPLMVV